MIFKPKKQDNQPNGNDIALKDFLNALLRAYSRLATAAETVIIKKGVLDLYPRDDFHKAATSSLIEAKKELSSSLLHYNIARDAYNNYLEEHKRFLNTTSQYVKHTLDGHKIVENIYRDFYKTRK